MTFDPMGTTALITGASSGLGLEFARRLAERGANLVLVARREDRLHTIAGDLTTRFGADCTVIPLDLTRSDAVAGLVAELAAKEIRISTLVNNAGFGNYGEFAGLDPAALDREIQLNVLALAALSRAFLPELLEANTAAAGTAALVNIASTAAFQPIPKMAVYGGSKAFVLSFTEALAFETRTNGLKVVAVCPGPTSTEFVEVAQNEDMMFGGYQTAEQVVETAFRALDRRRTPASVVSGSRNAFMAAGVRLAPRRLALDLAGGISTRKKR